MKGLIQNPFFITAVLVCAIVLGTDKTAVAQVSPGMEKKAYVDNQLIVKFSGGINISRQQAGRLSIDDPQIRELNRMLNVISAESLVPDSPGANGSNSARNSQSAARQPVLYTFGEKIDVDAVIRILMKTGFYEYAEPNYMGYGGAACRVTPNDEYYDNRQWGLSNDGTLTANSIQGADIDMEKAWAITTGDSSVVVAILDSGIKLDHPEFEGRLWVNADEIAGNLLDDDDNGYYNDIHGWDFVNNDNDPVDDHGHGTNVAGIVGATGNNGIGYAGVDWKCKLMACKILDENNSGLYSTWISGIYYAVNNGADVINMSVGGTNYSASMKDAVNYARNNGVPVVASMMNLDSDQVFYPAGYESVIAVGATNPDHTRSSPFFYDAASGSNYGSHIDISAPGNYIYGLNYKGNNDYNRMWGGTSQAAPHVTGVISLIKGMNGGLSVDSIKSILYSTAMDEVGRPGEDVAGWDKYHGHGVLNAHNALSKLAATYVDQPVCSGSDFTFPDGTVRTNITESIKHTSTLLSQNNCDSVVVTSLVIKPTYSRSQEVSVCSGENYTFPDGTIATDISEAFNHLSQLTTTHGCDSLISTIVKVNAAYEIDQEAAVCSGEDYTFPDGTTITGISSEVVHTSTFQTTKHCDSLITTTVSVRPKYHTEQEVQICSGESYVFADKTELENIVEDTVYTSHFKTEFQCDSLITTSIQVLPYYEFSEEVEVCHGNSYTFPDGTLKEDITSDLAYTSTLTTATGCDSLITTQVEVKTIDASIQVSEQTLVCNALEAEYQWVNCADGQMNIEGEVSKAYQPLQSGSYAVVVSKGGCEATSECVEVTPLGVGDPGQELVKVYPNPTYGELSIETGGLGKKFKVEVTDLSGKAINVPVSYESRKLKVNIDRPSGIYLLHVYDKAGVTTFKIVKE
ncbi:hypothetical protein GCM10009122_44990 [Fulvivirga kasyanovii]|nr:S8 family peptidase [Fulvivirga kasyanovii]